MSKLKIYMCSGVGATRDDYAYWLDDTRTVSNTRAVNTLLARINELCVELDYLPLSEAQQLEHYNHIDLLVVALQFAKECAGNDGALTRAGYVIQKAINDGQFTYEDSRDDQRGDHLDRVYSACRVAFDSGAAEKVSGEFISWWLAVIVPANRCGLSETQQQAITAALNNSGVGDSEAQFKRLYGDIGVYLYNSSEYFFYLYIPTDKAAKLPLFLRKKISKQKEVYDYVAHVFTSMYGSQDDMERIIRTRIIAQCGHTPEEAIEQLLGTRGIGLSSEIIAFIIIVAVAAVLAILGALINSVTQVLAAKYAVPDNIEDGCAEESDWPDNTTGKSNLVKYGVVAVVLYFLFQ